MEHFILISVALVLNILLSWAFVTSLNFLVMCKPPWWFEWYFRRSTWIHCWLLLVVLSDYFGQLVTSTFLLCKFWGLPGSTGVYPCYEALKVSWNKDIVSSKLHKSPETGWETCQSENRREASIAKSRKSLFHFKPEKVNKFEYCDNLWKQNIFHNQVLKLKACL